MEAKGEETDPEFRPCYRDLWAAHPSGRWRRSRTVHYPGRTKALFPAARPIQEDMHQAGKCIAEGSDLSLEMDPSGETLRGCWPEVTDKPDRPLFHYTKETYQGAFEADLLEQYKLYVQSAENVSARRLASGRYLLAVNAALAALYGFQAQGSGPVWLTIPFPILGFAVSLLWFQIILSHRDLNKIKFGIIHQLEENLPAALYAREWDLAEHGRGSSYLSVTTIERWIPLIFIVLHLIFLFLLVANCLSAEATSPSG